MYKYLDLTSPFKGCQNLLHYQFYTAKQCEFQKWSLPLNPLRGNPTSPICVCLCLTTNEQQNQITAHSKFMHCEINYLYFPSPKGKVNFCNAFTVNEFRDIFQGSSGAHSISMNCCHVKRIAEQRQGWMTLSELAGNTVYALEIAITICYSHQPSSRT